jgi:hypothetical protein
MTRGNREGRTAIGFALAVVAVVAGACGLGEKDRPPGPQPIDRRLDDRVTDPPADGLVITPEGLPGLQLNRRVLDVSTSDVEDVLGSNDFVMAPQTEDCGLSSNQALGVAAVTNADLAVVGFVVERPDAATREGIRAGSTVDDIVEAYGRDLVFARDVPSRTGGRVIWVTDLGSPGSEPTASSLHYAFDTGPDGTVTRIRSGFWPHVAHADYCSDEAGRPSATGWPLT